MNKKLIRRIIAWVGVVSAVAFAAFMVLHFFSFGERADAILTALLWVTLALAIICFGMVKFVIVDTNAADYDSEPMFSEAGLADDGENDITDGNDYIPETEGNEQGKEKDNGGGN